MLHLRRSIPSDVDKRSKAMSDTEYDSKLDELDRLLNDPDSPMDPSKVWTLLAEVSQAEACAAANAGQATR
jgi:hypothetical protein